MKDLEYTGQRYYLLEVAGLRRDLPVIEVAQNQWIASFMLLDDTELVTKCGLALAVRLAEWNIDYLLVPEGRGLPLAQVIANSLSTPESYFPYIVVRKGIKSYMRDPLTGSTNTITTSGEQMLALDGPDAHRIRGRRVCILDDLISTGGTIRAVASLARLAKAEVCCVAAVLLEGEITVADPTSKTDGIPVVWLRAIPMFT